MQKKIIISVIVVVGILLMAGYFAYSRVSPNNGEWGRRLEAALVPSECSPVKLATLPANYYQGPLIDTHFHMPPLDDDFGGFDLEFNDSPRGADSELYDQIADDDQPLLGRTLTVDQVACALIQEGTNSAFTFFPVYPDAAEPMVELANRTMQLYPDLFIPFIQASGEEVSTVEGKVLQQMLNLAPGLFDGIGETGDSPTEPINPTPDSLIYTGVFAVARQNNLMVYFHPSPDHQVQLDHALTQFPDVTFIVHGDFVRPHIDNLLANNPNLYFTANDIFEDIIPMFRFGDKQDFINAMEDDWDALLADAVRLYKPLINKYPDRFMWGTDRADIAWNYDADIGILLSRFGRAFIGQLDPAVQDKVAHENAERLINQRDK